MMILLFSRSFQLIATTNSSEWIDFIIYKILLVTSQSNQSLYLKSSLQALSAPTSPVVTGEQLIFLHFILDSLDTHTGSILLF